MRKRKQLLAVVLCLSVFFATAQGCGLSDPDDGKDIVSSENKGIWGTFSRTQN